MAGLLDQEMQQPEAAPQEEPRAMPEAAPAVGEGGDISPEAIEAKLHLPEGAKDQLDRIVVAGLKVMFDPQSHKMMLDELNKPGPIEQKLGEGIAGLLAILFQQSQRSVPPQLLIPAGSVLMAHAVKWLKEAGQEVTVQQFGAALSVMTEAILRQFNIDPDKVGATGAPGAPAEQAPAAGEPPQQPGPQGLIAGAQGA